jgi:hypothetical protein
MQKYKILIGGCVRQDPVVLGYYLKSLERLQIPRDAEARFGFVNDGGEEQLSALSFVTDLAIVMPAEQRPPGAEYAVAGGTHLWNTASIDHVGRQKQRLINYAIETGYTHIFFVDSDLLLEPTTLVSLWETKSDIANAVFWTAWQQGSQPGPQCWLTHPYNLNGLGIKEPEFIRTLAERQATRCLGGGACVLIAVAACKKGLRYHPRLQGLPEGGMWQGEDRTFALLAQRLHERQLADGWPDVFHAYHPEQRTEEALADAWDVLGAPRQLRAAYGDQINLVIDPMEDEALAASLADTPELRCMRGRLGALRLAPEIEAAVLTMGPGDERLLNVQFPPWYEVEQYQGQRRLLRLRLVDIKPYSYPPVLAETAFAGLATV